MTGTPALTSRGLKEIDFETIAEFLDELLDIAMAAKLLTSNFFGSSCEI